MNSLKTSTTSLHFLKGEGEMARRTREFDWSRTPVGVPENWPQSLRSAVSTVLRSKFPMFIWWGKDLIQFYNDAYRPSLGNDGKHPLALGQRGEECWPEIWPVIYPLIRQVLDGGESTYREDQLIPIYRNGKMEDVYWTFGYSALLDDQGEIAGVLVVCNENTDKVNDLRRIRESEELLSFAIEAAELATWDYNPYTDKFISNTRLKDWFGLEPSDEIALPMAVAAMIPTDRARVQAAIQRATTYESGGGYDIKYTIVNSITGQERIVRAKGRAWFDEQKKTATRFNGILQDITDQEIASLKLMQAENTLRLAIESADLGTYEVNLQTDQVITSARYNTIFDIPAHLSRMEMVQRIHPADQLLRARANEQALKTGLIDYEARVIWKDESVHWVKVKGRVIYDDENKPFRLMGIVQDITEQKLFAEQLSLQVKERTLELQRSNEDLMQFAHVITHDLKEPVRKVKIFSNRINDEIADQLPAIAKTYLNKIHSATDRMVAMIEGVLNYSKISAPEEAVELVDLNDLLDGIRTDLEVQVQQLSAVIIYDRLPVIRGVNILLYQLFYNLINNSLKFSRAGVAPKISVDAAIVSEEGRKMVRIVVSDNGIGFDQVYADTIFNTFVRLNSKDRYEGTGLGLALCKKITERHGGSISAISEAGKGASFIVLLPINNS